MTSRSTILTGMACALAGAVSAAGLMPGHALADPAAGRRLVEEVCQQCHGLDGVATVDEAPNLAGQKRSYLARQLWAFRAGERNDPKMSPSAVGLSDQDIIDVAEWYAAIPVTVGSPK